MSWNDVIYNLLEEARVKVHLMSILTNIGVENEIVISMNDTDIKGIHKVEAKIFLDSSENGKYLSYKY